MRRARTAAVTTTAELDAPARPLLPEATAQPVCPSPTPLPKPSAADRIREALQRWLEEDM